MKKVLLVLMILVAMLIMMACQPPHTHTITGELILVKEATCGEEGMAHMFCTGCGEVVNTISIPKTNNHTVIVISSEEATCEKSGLTEGKYCSACNKVLVEQEIIPAAHRFGALNILKEATKTEDGSAERYCTICNEYEMIVLPYTGSLGLKYTYNYLTNSYVVAGIGDCTDAYVIIPQKHEGLPVTNIGNDAFSYCTSIRGIEISDSVKNIGEGAFSYCYSLTSIEIPDSVISIDEFAFSECYSLTNIKIPNSVKSIGRYAFQNCSALTYLSIPSSVASIADLAFRGCDSLVSIEVDENNSYYKSIDGNLYTKDGKILIQYAPNSRQQSFTVPWGVEFISEEAFAFASSLTTIMIPDTVKSIDLDAFYACISLVNIEVDENNEQYKSLDGNLYTKDGKTLIQYAIGKKDTSFTIPDHVTSIGHDAFTWCCELKSVEIPDSVTSIGYHAFWRCESLTSIEIPNSVTSIDYYAFAYCSSLTSVYISESVINIENGAFAGCPLLTCVEVDENNENYKSIDGNLYSKDGKTFIQYTIGKTDSSFIIPDSVTTILDSAFREANHLTSVIIPNSVTSIGWGAFAYSDLLTIYCETTSQPYGWDSEWNFTNSPVVWGYKGE